MENKDTITGGTGERTWCVYLYTFPDGMFYYGKSSVEGLGKRHSDHACGKFDIGVWIRRWRMKGVEVKPEPVEFFGSERAALVRERELIEETDAVNKGLNMCEGGGQPPVLCGDKNPMKRSDVRRRHKMNIRAALNRPEVRAKLSANNAMKRPEVRAKHADSVKMAMNRPEVRAKMSIIRKKYLAKNPDKHPTLGKKHTKETLAKLSANNAMKRPEVRAKISANNAMKRPEARARLSESQKRAWARRKAAVVGA